MRGAIAAGHRLTAEAGAEILAEGGNAVDACLAAAFVSWVAESPLTGPAAGGFLLVHRARDRSDRLLDFFVSVPGQGSKRPPKPHMESIDIDFDATSQVVYLIGAGSCAVPGAVAGLEAAHERYGSLPWSRLLEPAIDLAREGVELTPQQAYLHAILDLILRHAPEGRAIYGESGRLTAGERVVMRDLASTLERLAEGGARELYRGELGRELVRFLAENGGLVTRADLAGLSRHLAPAEPRFIRGARVRLQPAAVVGRSPDRLRALAARSARGRRTGPAARRRSSRSSRSCASSRGRGRGASSGTSTGEGSRGKLLAEENIRAALRPNRAARGKRRRGCGCARDHAHLGRRRARKRGLAHGVDRLRLRRDRARHRHPHEQHARRVRPEPVRVGECSPGARLTSMMAPSIVLDDEDPRLVVGSAGSIRLRGAILQIVVNVVHHGMPVEEAIEAPRVHFDDGHVHCEGGSDPGGARAARGARLRPRPLASTEPLLRRRRSGRAPCRRLARGRGRPEARRAWHRRARMSDWLIVRPAVPARRRRARRARPRGRGASRSSG